ncbi:MAG: hypothetical protein RML34_10990 [Leptospiraceae bacterium]|nr:hypothetical protein [Leptospiraceae bacterium]
MKKFLYYLLATLFPPIVVYGILLTKLAFFSKTDFEQKLEEILEKNTSQNPLDFLAPIFKRFPHVAAIFLYHKDQKPIGKIYMKSRLKDLPLEKELPISDLLAQNKNLVLHRFTSKKYYLEVLVQDYFLLSNAVNILALHYPNHLYYLFAYLILTASLGTFIHFTKNKRKPQAATNPKETQEKAHTNFALELNLEKKILYFYKQLEKADNIEKILLYLKDQDTYKSCLLLQGEILVRGDVLPDLPPVLSEKDLLSWDHPLCTKDGRELLLPLRSGGTLLGILWLKGREETVFDENTATHLQRKAKFLAEEISHTKRMHEALFDQESGFYKKTYLSLSTKERFFSKSPYLMALCVIPHLERVSKVSFQKWANAVLEETQSQNILPVRLGLNELCFIFAADFQETQAREFMNAIMKLTKQKLDLATKFEILRSPQTLSSLSRLEQTISDILSKLQSDSTLQPTPYPLTQIS